MVTLVVLSSTLRAHVDLGNSAPRRSNPVCPDTRLFGIISVTHPVSKHLKEFDSREARVPESVVHLEVGAMG